MASKTHPWIESSDVVPMFPTLMWKIQLKADFHEAMDAKILGAIGRIRQELPPLGPGQGWQSHQALHELEEFGDLVSCAEPKVPESNCFRWLEICERKAPSERKNLTPLPLVI